MTGQFGVGKTFLVKQLSSVLTSRNIFKDGVHIFDLSEATTSNSIRSIMKEKLGSDFYENTHTYFARKKMLIVFDSYERVLDKKISGHKYLLDILK